MFCSLVEKRYGEEATWLEDIISRMQARCGISGTVSSFFIERRQKSGESREMVYRSTTTDRSDESPPIGLRCGVFTILVRVHV
jgi:hypothetical protein